MSKFHISIKKSILILGGTRKVSFQVGISRVVGPEILGGTLNPPAHYVQLSIKLIFEAGTF